MAVPVAEDEGLTGENVVRGFINFEGRTLDDCLRAIANAVSSITDGHTMGVNYAYGDRSDEGEVSFYRFEVE